MPLSRMENTTFAMPSSIDSHDMGLRTVYSPDAQKKTPIQYFVDGLKYGEIQKAVRMADVQGLKSALLYALHLEAATQASRRDCHSIRRASVTADEPCESRCIKEIEKLKE
ncbi:uncharacterized protein TNCV_4793031 [Trichonephila clavipes]|nr:uncharacterized protein TNCV_4793031 [Trichonephila clavipes]